MNLISIIIRNDCLLNRQLFDKISKHFEFRGMNDMGNQAIWTEMTSLKGHCHISFPAFRS